MPSFSRLPNLEERWIQMPGARLHLMEIPGGGPPMVLLHGIGMDWRVWQAISRRLFPHFHLYLVDLRGHGQSSKPEHGYTLAHYAADIEDLLDRLRLSRAVLVGSSLGGMVAASVEVPVDMVGYRVLVDPPMTGGSIRDREMYETILELKREPVPALADFLGASNPGAGRFLLETMSQMWHEAADGVIEDMLADPDRYFAIGPALRANESQTLLMQADPTMGAVLTAEWARQALQLLPHGSLVTVLGAGHAIHAYKPAEFVQIILDFVGIAR
jgi:pimeloyl-ACP methyl ester carboxylesterase